MLIKWTNVVYVFIMAMHCVTDDLTRWQKFHAWVERTNENSFENTNENTLFHPPLSRWNECYFLKKELFTTKNLVFSPISFNFLLKHIKQPAAMSIIALPDFYSILLFWHSVYAVTFRFWTATEATNYLCFGSYIRFWQFVCMRYAHYHNTDSTIEWKKK